MGLFDAIFGRRGRASEESADAEPAALTHEAALFQRAAHMEWDWSNAEARALTHEILGSMAPRFGNAKIKEVPDDEHIDLRGSYAGSPVRFAVWMSFGTFWSIEMRCPNAFPYFSIERDHEKIPKTHDADDPWSEGEDRRVFVAKGIFFEGDDDAIAEKLTTWSRIPSDLQERMLADMETLDATIIRTSTDGVAIHQKPGLRDLPTPGDYLEACAQLMAEIRDCIVHECAPEVVPVTAAVRSGIREIHCAFCHSLYLISLAHARCPNCGAPPSQ